MILTAPSITVTNDTVTDDSTPTLVCLSSISDISVSFVYRWTGPHNLVISGETDGILIRLYSIDLLMTWTYYELMTL